MLKKDRFIRSTGGVNKKAIDMHIEDELDKILDENVMLKEEETLLTEKFKALKKRQIGFEGG